MKKQLLTKWVSGIAVVVLTCTCMVLLFAEPAQCETWQKWMLTFCAIKVSAIVCGALAIHLACELTESERDEIASAEENK